jgi:hypothetical protein
MRRLLFGTKVALTRFNFLQNYNMAALQALVHFSVRALHKLSTSLTLDYHQLSLDLTLTDQLQHAIHRRCDGDMAWILAGTIVRIAHKMGYHRDGELLGLDSFETEMRRRLWWQIIILDTKSAMFSGLGLSPLPVLWDTCTPQNINDADIFPGCTKKVAPRNGPTEMAFVMLLCEAYKFKLAADNHHGLEAAILGQVVEPSNDMRQQIHALLHRMSDIENRYIDVNAGNVHRAATILLRVLRGMTSEILLRIQEKPEVEKGISGHKDSLFKALRVWAELVVEQYEPMEECGFLWFAKSYFQRDIFAAITSQLRHHSSGSMADRSWAGIRRIHAHHTELFDMSQKRYVIQAQITLKAWNAREQVLARTRRILQTPSFIEKLRRLVPFRDSPSARKHPTVGSMGVQEDPQACNIRRRLGDTLDITVSGWASFEATLDFATSSSRHEHMHANSPC